MATTGIESTVATENSESVWSKCLNFIQTKIGISSFETWFQTTRLINFSDSKAVIEVPNRFFADFIDEHYKSLVNTAFQQAGSPALSIDFIANEAIDWKIASDIAENRLVQRPIPRENALLKQFNPKYTFQNFVIGDSNQFACAASQAVSEAPGKTTFNPLVIYGVTGLGKTHLLQAIGNFALTNETAHRVVYVTSEQFTSEFMRIVRDKKSSEFHKPYEDTEILLVDDVQFFGGKPQTQEEFFRIFSRLYEMRQQIVITSDRPPAEIPDMTERLISRFSAGLIADIQPPVFETRMAILKQKAEKDGILLPEEVISYVANNITSNVRVLEGTLLKLIAYSSFTQIGITLDIAKEVLGDTIDKSSRRITLDHIQKTTAEALGLSPALLRSHTRKKEVAIARQLAMYLAKQHTSNSLRSIGFAMGGRDYSTVIHACKKIEKMIAEDSAFASKVEEMSGLIAA